MRRIPLHPTFALALLIVLALPVFLRAEDEPAAPVRITAAYEDADVRTVVTDIVKQASANVIISQAFEGTITVKFKDVPWREALEQVVRTAGFALVEEDYGILRVMGDRSAPNSRTWGTPKSNLGTDYYRFQHRLPETPSLTTVVPGTEPSLPPLVAALQRVVEVDQGAIRYVPAQKSVIFTGRPRTLETVKLLLVAFDQPPAAETAGAIREYEDRLVGSRTESAAKYFLLRLAELRGQ